MRTRKLLIVGLAIAMFTMAGDVSGEMSEAEEPVATTEVEAPIDELEVPAEIEELTASTVTTFGIDVSHHQATIDWPAVRAAGVRFAFIRVSEGITPDPYFRRNWREAAAVGITRGAYQLFRPRHDGTTQADLFISMVGRRERGDFPPVLDVEADDRRSTHRVVNRVRRWIERYRTQSGLDRVIIYTGHFWGEIDSPRMPGTDLWVAHYTDAEHPRMPGRWGSWRFWQYSERGHVPGIHGRVDLDRFNGDEAAMLAYANTL